MAKGDRGNTTGSTEEHHARSRETHCGRLADKKKMGAITLVTPPSFFQNQNGVSAW
jgi:hypothetical protein